MKTVVIHPFGNPFAYNAALAFYERGELAALHTCLFAPLNSKFRFHPALKEAPIVTHPAFESFRLFVSRLPKGSYFARDQRFVDFVGSKCDQAASRDIDEETEIVYGYEDSAFHSFERAAKLGARRIYDLPIGFYKAAIKLLGQEAEREPSLSPFLQSLKEPEEKLRHKDREIALASQVICASSFTARTVPNLGDSAPIRIIPYGADCSMSPKQWAKADTEGPLKLIFVGRLDPRKGLHTLFAALDAIPKQAYQLTLAGRWIPGFESYLNQRYSVSYTDLGQVQQTALSEIFKQNHVLVFPSLFEGFGLVLLEAMAAGIPVIATERTAAPDILTKDSGFVVEAGSSAALLEQIEAVIADRRELADRGLVCRRIAESLSWELYRSRLFSAVAEPETAQNFSSLSLTQ